ncbi:MAG: hypothetical protein ACKO26_19335 [Planctomycetota bacterium]
MPMSSQKPWCRCARTRPGFTSVGMTWVTRSVAFGREANAYLRALNWNR